MSKSESATSRHQTLWTEARDAGDNWLGLADSSERRKLQNKLHQRAWRRRRKASRASGQEAGSKTLSPDQPWTGHGILVPADKVLQDEAQLFRESYTLCLEAPPSSSHGYVHKVDETRPCLVPKRWTMIESSFVDVSSVSPSSKTVETATVILPRQLDLPLSSDHMLITMVQYNVKRAMLSDMAILGLLNHVSDKKKSSLSFPPLSIPWPTSIPPSFQPTALQERVPHDPLITTVPSPAMRDNLILHAGTYDAAALSHDLFGGLFEGFDDGEVRGVMVWGEPWSPDSWEVTDGFFRRWGFLTKGCNDLIVATNRWRESRGEEPLVVEI